jgi:CAAX protease family protein
VWNASNSEDSVVDDLLSGGQPVLFAVLALVLLTAVTAPLAKGRGTAEQQEAGTPSVPAR